MLIRLKYRKAAHGLLSRLYQGFLDLWPEEAALINWVKKAKTETSLSHTYICVGLITFIIALYYLCTTKRVVNSRRFWPERIKVSNKTVAGALSFVPW